MPIINFAFWNGLKIVIFVRIADKKFNDNFYSPHKFFNKINSLSAFN
jgi:hypothetical protein